MRKITILYVITKLELGGAQKQLLSLMRHVNRGEFNLFLLTAREGLLLPEFSSIVDSTLKKSRWLERPLNPFKDLAALFEIFNFIKKNKIDIVHTHSSKAGILGRCAARFANVNAIVHTVHGWSFNDYQPIYLRIFFIWLERLTAKFTDKLIVVSEYDRHIGLKHGIGSENKYVLIRYGIDSEEFAVKDQGLKEELGIPENCSVVTMIACLKPQKAPQDFVELAFLISKKFPNTKFILVGDGALHKTVAKLIEKYNLGKDVFLLGWRRDIPRLLATTDILVLTSLWEGLPITILEGIASKKPVVATDTGGVAEIIKDGCTGFLVKKHDINAMSEKLITLLKDSQLSRLIGQAAKDALGKVFTTGYMLESTRRMYSSLIQDKIIAHGH